jgi:serine/threonine protein kinase/tetratricopeptide (TPR) repeat protein
MGRYIVVRLLGTGGMGAVYEAYDPNLGRKVALKVLHSANATDSSSISATRARADRARLLREAKNLARLAHPNVVSIFDVGTIGDDETAFVAMEFIEGDSLRPVFEENRASWRERLEFVLQAGRGLAAAHAVGLLHRDFKPENILVGADGLVRVLDFGLSKDSGPATGTTEELPLQSSPSHLPVRSSAAAHESEHTSTASTDEITQFGTYLGTPAYMAPEQLTHANLDPAADLFAFACVLFEAIYNKKPFPSALSQRYAAIAAGKIRWPRRPAANVSPAIVASLARALAFDRQQRGPSVQGLIDEIETQLARADRRRTWTKILVFTLVPLIAGVAWLQRPRPALDPACEDQSPRLAHTWNDQLKNALRQGFLATNMPIAQALGDQASAALDQWGQEWIASAARLCPARRAEAGLPPLDPQTTEQAKACLAESQAEVSALVHLWQQPNAQQVLRVQGAIRSLMDPAKCSDLETLAERDPLPTDPHRRAIARQRLESIQEARMQIDLADYEKAHATLDAIRTGEHDPIELPVEARRAAAVAALDYRQSNKALDCATALDRAVLLAMAANMSQVAVQSALQLWYIRIYRANQRELHAEAIREREAQLIRGKSPSNLVFNHERNLGIWANMNGRYPESLPHFDRALKSAVSAFGAQSKEAALILDDLGVTANFLGDLDQARSYFVAVHDLKRKLYPEGHPDLSAAIFRLVEAHLNLGNLDDALDEMRQGWSQCERAGVSATACAEFPEGSMYVLFSMGRYDEALLAAYDAQRFESLVGRRLSFENTSIAQTIALILHERGESNAALALANEALAATISEEAIHPRAIVLAYLNTARISITHGAWEIAHAQIEKAAQVLATPTENSPLLQVELKRVEGLLALARGRARESSERFEAALASAELTSLPKFELGPLHLNFAQALVELGDLDLALYHTRTGLNLLRTGAGLQASREVPFHELLARIAMQQERFGDALSEVELARNLFDPVEKLEPQMAPLLLTEAAAWWALDHATPLGRAHARRLATEARAAFQAWDTGASAWIAKTKAWLASHPAH